MYFSQEVITFNSCIVGCCEAMREKLHLDGWIQSWTEYKDGWVKFNCSADGRQEKAREASHKIQGAQFWLESFPYHSCRRYVGFSCLWNNRVKSVFKSHTWMIKNEVLATVSMTPRHAWQGKDVRFLALHSRLDGFWLQQQAVEVYKSRVGRLSLLSAICICESLLMK